MASARRETTAMLLGGLFIISTSTRFVRVRWRLRPGKAMPTAAPSGVGIPSRRWFFEHPEMGAVFAGGLADSSAGRRKVDLARRLGECHLTPYRWIAANLRIGASSYVQSRGSRRRRQKDSKESRVVRVKLCNEELGRLWSVGQLFMPPPRMGNIIRRRLWWPFAIGRQRLSSSRGSPELGPAAASAAFPALLGFQAPVCSGRRAAGGDHPTTLESWKIGRNMAMTMPPMTMPRKQMRRGSIREVRAPTRVSTSAS